MNQIRSNVTWMFAALAVAMLAGCGYTLRGKVVRGESSGIELVHKIDHRLKQTGLSNAEVIVRRDPKSMNPTLAGRDRTNAAGDFSMSIKEFGAGWMEEQWLVRAGLHGHQNAESLMKLPSDKNWLLLITLAPGTASPLDEPDEIIQDFERFR